MLHVALIGGVGEDVMLQRLQLALAVTAAAIMAMPSASQAQLRVCNKSSVDVVDVAFGRHRGRTGWESEGWFKIRRGRCETLVARALRDRYYYLYAEGGDTTWNGDDEKDGSDFCIRPGQVFKLNDASLTDEDNKLNCEKFGYVTKRFMQVDTEDADEFTYELTD